MEEKEFGVEDLAKYPFLEEAGEYFKERSLGLDDISHPDYNAVLKKAEKRVLQAIRGKEITSNEFEETELKSFPISLILVKATNLEHLISRYSFAEALRVEKLLKKEDTPMVIRIFKNTLKIDIIAVKSEDSYPQFNYKIQIIDYLKRSISFHELEWKLVNKVVNQGYVYLKTNELIRLIRQEIQNMIKKRLKGLSVPELPSNFKQIVKNIASLSPPPRIISNIAISPENYPPCVKTALTMLKKGENLPHYGRFLLTTYLVNTGSSVEHILSLYSKSPDFNERISKYQIEHIAGLRGGRVKYSCPSCRTLITHSFCFKIEVCNNIINPLKFDNKNFQSTKGKKNKK